MNSNIEKIAGAMSLVARDAALPSANARIGNIQGNKAMGSVMGNIQHRGSTVLFRNHLR